MKKFKLSSDFIEIDNIKLYRIQALVDINKIDIKIGDLGGYIEKESNLSHSDDAWVFDNARVYGDAKVFGNARVSGRVFGNVSGSAEVIEYKFNAEDVRVLYNEFKIKTPSHKIMTTEMFSQVYQTWLEFELLKIRHK